MCGSAYDAEDLVQETFARVVARPRVLRRDDPAPYLLRALKNTYLTSIRTASRRPRTTELPPDESAAMQSTLAAPEVALEQHETFEAIAALPEDFRAALIAGRRRGTLAPRGGPRAGDARGDDQHEGLSRPATTGPRTR